MVTRALSASVFSLGFAWTSPAPAQYMALTHQDAPARRTDIVPPAAPLPPPRPTARILDGELPNQRTGPRHERVVRDICIGCDR